MSKGSSLESKSESAETKSVKYEKKTENVVQESSEEHHTSDSLAHKLGVDTKRREVVYSKVVETSHRSEHSESVVEASEIESSLQKGTVLQRFGAVPVLPFEGRHSVFGNLHYISDKMMVHIQKLYCKRHI